MHKLLDIKEDSIRDMQMHYSGAILYNTETREYMSVSGFDGSKSKMLTLYRNSKKESKDVWMPLSDFCDKVKAVCVYDGYVNLNGYCLFLERQIDGKYKKCTTLNNTAVQALGLTYIRAHNKRVKREIDAYTVLKAMKGKYYNYPEALSATDKMFSVAMTPALAIVKQPLPEDAHKLHVVYDRVYVGEIKDQRIEFESELIRELVIEQLKEIGYEA